jgi:DNA (cytosine-5)-methyltransferase 1
MTLAKGKKRTGQGQLSLWEEGPNLEKEAEERSRCTMWTPLDWAERWNYKAIVLENVVDAHLWSPFDAWLAAWRSLGYDFQLCYINSMHIHPTPQSRDRMYFVAWKKGNPKPNLDIRPLAYCLKCEKDVNAVQCWKKSTRKFGKYKQQYTYCCPTCVTTVTPYYYAAANAIDWSIPAPRIGNRKKPLKPKTLQRIEYGLRKFAGSQPVVFSTSHSSSKHSSYVRSPEEALPTQTTRQDVGVVITPYIINLNHFTIQPIDVEGQPFPTQTERIASRGLVVPPFLMDHLAEYRPRDITGPMSTVCAAGNHHSLITPPNTYLMTYYGNGQVLPLDQSVPTVTTLDRHAVVTTPGGIPAVEDCCFRMLAPHEIQAAMAFPKDYVLTGNHREKVKQLGNACTPPVIKLLMERVVASLA